jgi:ABC-type oligopeptide transport system substrate-binding subunit
MSSRILVSRPAAARVAGAALIFLGAIWIAADLPAQDPAKAPPPAKRPRMEEEEDPKASPPPAGKQEKENADQPKKEEKKQRIEEEDDTSRAPRKVIHVDDEDNEAKLLPGHSMPNTADLATLARETKNRFVARLYRQLKFPHDEFTLGGSSPRVELVAPIPVFVGDNPAARWPHGGIKLQTLDAEGKPEGKQRTPPETTIKLVRHYEQIALEAVSEFLKIQERLSDTSPDKLPREQQLAVAEAALTLAVRFHESARSAKLRTGEEWDDAVAKPLRSHLLDIRLEQLKALAEAGQWTPAFNLTVVLAREFQEPEEQRRIAKPLAELLEASFKSGVESDEGVRLALQRLRELEEHFPDKNVLKPISKKLQNHAMALWERAKKVADDKNYEKALEMMGQAVELWPEKSELRAYQRVLMQTHRILRVGVRTLPDFMSPALATTDSELRATELIFESLVKYGVDAAGNAHFVPGLARSRPHVEALGRLFYLPRDARWSNGQPLTANDIRATVEWLKRDKGNHFAPVTAQLLDAVQVRDPYRVHLLLQQGYIDPLALMTFKVQPGEPDLDSDEFGRNPIGSGPFSLDKDKDSEAGRTCKSFVFNPFYGTRQGKEGLPRIREIRFFGYKPYEEDGKSNPTEEFERPQSSAPLDMILDLTPEHAAAIARKGSASRVRIARPGDGETATRRVYFLAINNKRSPLDDAESNLRRALAHAINREKLLDDCFRQKVDPMVKPILSHLHAALNGPYPAGSWACDPKVGQPITKGSLDLYDEAKARGLYSGLKDRIGKNIHVEPFELKYPIGDPAVKAAMEGICQQWQAVLGFRAEALAVEAHQLRKDVESGNYELAYYYYDFQDDTFCLAPLLAPRPGQESLNIFGTASSNIEAVLQDIRVRREPERVKKDAWKIHEYLYSSMPFIPLWQLDPLAAIHNSVKAPRFDPLLVFPEVDQWTAEPR